LRCVNSISRPGDAPWEESSGSHLLTGPAVMLNRHVLRPSVHCRPFPAERPAHPPRVLGAATPLSRVTSAIRHRFRFLVARSQSDQLREGNRSGRQEVRELAGMLAHVRQVYVEEGLEGLAGMGVPAGAASPKLTVTEVRQDFTSSGPTVEDVAEQLSTRITDVWEFRCAMIVDALILGTLRKLGRR